MVLHPLISFRIEQIKRGNKSPKKEISTAYSQRQLHSLPVLFWMSHVEVSGFGFRQRVKVTQNKSYTDFFGTLG